MEREAGSARAVVTTDGRLWTASAAFCSLVGRDEGALQQLDWRTLVHASDRSYLNAHLVEVLAGEGTRREFDVRLVRSCGAQLPAHVAVELASDRGGRQRWFLLEARLNA